MSRFQTHLMKSGLTNHDSEDFGAVVLSPTKIVYRYYCTSVQCAGTSDTAKKHIATTKEWLTTCPKCKYPLTSKRVKE